MDTVTVPIVKPTLWRTRSTSSMCIGCSNNNTEANSRLSAWGFKDKKGDLGSKNNFRPIALTTIMSKLFKILILN